MSMYSQFKTEADLETKGIDVDYGDFVVKIARAGGANKNYQRILEAKTKPVRRAIDTGTLPKERLESILMEVVAEAVVLDWHSGSEDKRVRGIELEDGTIGDVTYENILNVFKKLPDLFWDIHEQAGKHAVFRKVSIEAESKN